MNARLVGDADANGDALTAARTRATGLAPIGSSRYGVLPSSDDGGAAMGSGPKRRRAPRTFLPTRPTGMTAGGMSARNKIYAATATGLVALVAAVTLGVTLAKRGSSSGDDGCAYAGYRLADVAVPASYALSWRPDFGAPYGFSGNISIDVTMTAAGQSCLQLHADGLTVTAATVVEAPGGQAAPASVARYDTANQRVVLALPRQYDAGTRLLVNLAFSGSLGTDMTGLYRSSYKNDAGATVDIVVTQFEATAARRAFPCFDEPAYKAGFNVSVDGVPAGYTALGNMPVAAAGPSSAVPGSSTVAFAPSPRMSTYLVALVVAPLVGVTGTTSTGVNVTAWAVNRANNTERLGLALRVALDVLPYYGSLFGGLQYPLPKMDMVAVPDFAAGAMENWGLLTYRETALLAKEDGTSSAAEQQRVSVVVAHEAAHQWFGDLTTMQFWDALFLNEGFATLVEYIGADHATPQFETGRQFFTGDVLPAMRASYWASSRPLVSDVDSSAAIESQFDGVSYSFGGSLLQSARGFMERRVRGSFFAGVGAYLTAHQYANAEPSALWAALGAAAGLPDLPAYLGAYTTQVGYPLVTLAWADPATGEATGIGVLTVSQARHFFSPASAALAPAGQGDYTWWVPLTLTCAGAGPNPVTAAADAALASGGFTSRVWATTIGTPGAPYNISAHGWVHANSNASGFFRVNYPVSVWRALAAGAAAQLAGAPAAAGATPLSPLDRAAMLDDLWTLAEGGMAPGVDTPLALDAATAVLPLETAYEVWVPALSHLGNLRQLLFVDDGTTGGGAACLANLESVARSLLAPLVAALGWGTPGEPPITTSLRAAALSSASNFNLTNVTANASALFGAWAAQYAAGVDAPTAIAADLQSAVFASAVRWGVVAPARGGGTASAFSILLGAAAATDDAATKRRYLAALAASRDPASLSTLLASSLNASIVRPQDTVSTLTDVASNPVGRPLAWAFTKANWDVLMQRYGSGGFALSNLVSATSEYFTTQALYDDVAAWYAAHPLQGAVIEWHQSLEAVAARAAWRAAQLGPTCAKLAAMAPAA